MLNSKKYQMLSICSNHALFKIALDPNTTSLAFLILFFIIKYPYKHEAFC